MKFIKLRMKVLFHVLGLSCLGGSIFLQVLVFVDIAVYGHFIAIENNPIVLSLEIGLTVFAFIYFIYIYQRTLIAMSRRSIKKR